MFNTLTEEEHDALANIYNRLESATVLALARSKGPTTLAMDVCDNETGCISIHEQSDWTKEPPVIGRGRLSRKSRTTIQHIERA